MTPNDPAAKTSRRDGSPKRRPGRELGGGVVRGTPMWGHFAAAMLSGDEGRRMGDEWATKGDE
jgi:hypothetical protein